MDSINIYHYMIIALDVLILIVLGRSFIIHFLGRKADRNYHTRWLIVCTCLFVANSFALITSVYAYYIYKITAPELLNFGRFADRYLMFFSYLFFNKIEERD
jgi:hypothetical protein